MSKSLVFILENIDIKEKHTQLILDGFIEIHKVLKDKKIVISKDTDYRKLYDYAYDEMNSELFHKLNPSGKGLNGIYEPRGGDFTNVFWTYLSCIALDQDPTNSEDWKHFGLALNDYVYDMDEFMLNMFGDSKKNDPFPISRLVSNLGIMDDWAMQEFLIRFISSKGFILSQIRLLPSSETLSNIFSRLRNLSTMRYDSWIKLAKATESMISILDNEGIKMTGHIKDNLEISLLLPGELNVDLIKNLLNSAISELQEGCDSVYETREVANSVIMSFISNIEPSVAQVLKEGLDPAKISLPVAELGIKVLLLTTESKSKTRPSYYDDFFNAYTIYSGGFDGNHMNAYEFRKELQEELAPICVAGFTKAVKENNLNLLV